jgi:hypothetical protein
MSGVKLTFSKEAVDRFKEWQKLPNKTPGIFSPWMGEEMDLEGDPILDEVSKSEMKDVAHFGPEELKSYINHVTQKYQTDLSRSGSNEDKLKYILSVILQYQTLTWNALLKRYETRDGFEILKTTIQCNEIIGTPEDGTQCWLCGYPMDDLPYINPKYEEWNTKTLSIYASNSPQCEHLLSVSSGLMLYGLPVSTDDARTNTERYSHNYGWAHARCNGLKSSYLFVDIFDRNADGSPSDKLLTTPIYNAMYLNKYLEVLYKKLFKSGNLKPGVAVPEKRAWIRSRVAVIKPKFDILLAEISKLRAADSPLYADFNLTREQVQRCIFGIQKRYEDTVVSSEGAVKDPEVASAFRDQPGLVYRDTICKYFTKEQLTAALDYLVKQGLINDRIQAQVIAICSSHTAGRKRKRTRRVKKNGKFSTSRRRFRSKNGGRKNSRSHRKA